MHGCDHGEAHQAWRRRRDPLRRAERRPGDAGNPRAHFRADWPGTGRIGGPDHRRPFFRRHLGYGRGPRCTGSLRRRADCADQGRRLHPHRRKKARGSTQRHGQGARGAAQEMDGAQAALHPRTAGEIHEAGFDREPGSYHRRRCVADLGPCAIDDPRGRLPVCAISAILQQTGEWRKSQRLDRMPNRLAQETSPYLQQHAGNPVDWYAWGEEALQAARAQDKPILLSIGYSACHWCHVMAHESFEDAEVAAVMNRHFINIKVDREERPDLDQIYQLAHQMISQRSGGWPLTMFLTPGQEPFFGGTYFPKTQRYGLPGFPDLLLRVAQFYHSEREQIAKQSEAILSGFGRMQPASPAHGSELSSGPIDGALENLAASYDARYGGFGAAPKFPHPTDLELCLRRHAASGVHQSASGAHEGASASRGANEVDPLKMAIYTLGRMAVGGICDQLGGGFCRYSVDAYWLIPHFEKMLYDNGPLLARYSDAWALTRDPLFAEVRNEP